VLYVSTPSDETVIRLTIKQPQTGGYSSLLGGGGEEHFYNLVISRNFTYLPRNS